MGDNRNPFMDQQRTSQTVAAASVDTDASGDFSVQFGELRRIENKEDVTAQAEGGYVANVQSVTGNTATIRVYEGGGAAAELDAVNASNVTNVNATAHGQ